MAAEATIEVLEPGPASEDLLKRLDRALPRGVGVEQLDPPGGNARVYFSAADVDHKRAVELIEEKLDEIDRDNWRRFLRVVPASE